MLVISRSWHESFRACHAAAQLDFHRVGRQILFGEGVIWFVGAGTRSQNRWLGLVEFVADVELWLLYVEAHGSVHVCAWPRRDGLAAECAPLLLTDYPLLARLRDRHVLVEVVLVGTRTDPLIY